MFYKVLGQNGESLHGGDLIWPLPTEGANGEWVPGAWVEVEGEIKACSNGLHLTTEPGNWYKPDCRIFIAEGEGDCASEGDKTAFRRARLLREVPHPDWWERSRNFIAGLKEVPFFKPDGKPLPEWKLFTAPTLDAARRAAWDAARDAARAAARDAAWDAARDAAWSAARDAAWDAARDAAWSAAWSAARDAARDAALYNEVESICGGLGIDPKHRNYAKRQWEAWLKGYAVLCDVDGLLYVYAVADTHQGSQ
jgi:hypothetical protein